MKFQWQSGEVVSRLTACNRLNENLMNDALYGHVQEPRSRSHGGRKTQLG